MVITGGLALVISSRVKVVDILVAGSSIRACITYALSRPLPRVVQCACDRSMTSAIRGADREFVSVTTAIFCDSLALRL